MSVIKDAATYDALHNRLLRDLLLAIKDELDAAELDHDQVHELTYRIGLAVGGLLDGNGPLEAKGETFMPVLGFAGEAQPERLLVGETGSYLQQGVRALFEAGLDEQEPEDDEDEDEDEEEDEFEYEEDADEDLDEDEDEDEDSDDDSDNATRH